MYPESMRVVRRVVPLAAMLWAAVAASASQADQKANLCGQVPTIASELTQISGLPLKHPVPCDFITKDKVKEFLEKRVKEETKPDEVRAEELVLKKFGFVPQDFNLATSTVDLLTEQAAAFYDYNRKKLFITETKSTDPLEPVLAHELAHALADQSFNLAKYIKQGRKSDDGSSARLAVMEGQATWLMSEYMARRNGQSLRESPELAKAMSNMSETGGEQFPVYDKSPLYLRVTLIFPYTKGLLFQNAVVQRYGNEGFAMVFRHAPVSTQQIIHPDKYFADVKPTDPPLPDPKLPHSYKGLIGGSFGELEHGILLDDAVGKEQSAEISPHWRGCSFELREDKKAGRDVLLYASDWDSEASAQQFFAAYRKMLAKKWKSLKVASESASEVTGAGDDGRFVLSLSGTRVTSVEGLDPAID